MQIVGVDSATAYRGMDVGTSKPTAAERGQVPHHLFDVVDPTEPLTAADYQIRARRAVAEIDRQGEVPLLVGGSGLYFRAVVDPLEFPGTDATVRRRLQDRADSVGSDAMYRLLQQVDPEAAERIHPANVRRTVRALEVAELTGEKFSSYRTAWDRWESIYDLTAVGLRSPIEELDRRIDERVDRYIEQGWVHEVANLRSVAWPWSATAHQVLGYALILDHLDGKLSLQEAVEEVKRRTRKYARRQLRWFKFDPRIEWFEDPDSAAQHLIQRLGR